MALILSMLSGNIYYGDQLVSLHDHVLLICIDQWSFQILYIRQFETNQINHTFSYVSSVNVHDVGQKYEGKCFLATRNRKINK